MVWTSIRIRVSGAVDQAYLAVDPNHDPRDPQSMSGTYVAALRSYLEAAIGIHALDRLPSAISHDLAEI